MSNAGSWSNLVLGVPDRLIVKPLFYTNKGYVHRIASCGLTETLTVVVESVLCFGERQSEM